MFCSKVIFSLSLILLDPDDNVYTARDWERGVRASVAEQRLLVFRAGDGWAPLCRLDPRILVEFYHFLFPLQLLGH